MGECLNPVQFHRIVLVFAAHHADGMGESIADVLPHRLEQHPLLDLHVQVQFHRHVLQRICKAQGGARNVVVHMLDLARQGDQLRQCLPVCLLVTSGYDVNQLLGCHCHG